MRMCVCRLAWITSFNPHGYSKRCCYHPVLYTRKLRHTEFLCEGSGLKSFAAITKIERGRAGI